MTSLHADEAFLEHYQFSHDPFAARVPGFKFFPAQRKSVLGQLHHLARYSQLLLVVSGPRGSGKTLLRQALVASTNKQAVQSVVISGQGAADPSTVLRQVAQGLQVQQSGVQAILAQVGQLALTGQEVYVLVDDAEQLSEAALTSLLALAAGSAEGRAHVFLFSEPGLMPRLESLAEGGECFHVIELQPYSEDESREYLAQRLEGAGRGLEVFTAEQLADIHEQSEAWPGLINQVARETLIETMLARRGAAKRSWFPLSLPKKHLLALAVVGIGVFAAWMMQGRSGGEVMSPVAQLPLKQNVAPTVLDSASEAADPNPPAIEFAGANQPLPLPLVGEAQPVIREPLAQAAGLTGAEEADVAGRESAADVHVDESPLPVAPVTPVTPVAPAVKAEAPVTVVQVPKPEPVVKPAVPAAPSVNAALAVDWYGAQVGSRYTLQVFGARAEASAQAFVREQGAEYHYFKKQHQGQALYVVTYGSFSSHAAAQAALKGLPTKLQAGKPWPRTFASIKHEIAQAR
jgi:DamX protein